jgi:hypothetical protein
VKKLGTIICLTTICSLTFNSCSKEELVEAQSPVEFRKINQNESEFLEFAKRELSSVTVAERDIIDPKNLDNFMDEFGKSFESMIIHLNESEAANPSATKEQYLAKVTAYQLANPMNQDLMVFVNPGTEFYGVIATLVKETGSKEDAALAVAQLKSLESLLKDSELLSELEKTYLLALSASLKYTRSTIKNYGLQISEVNTNAFTAARMSCFDRVFLDTAEDGFSVLADYENRPVQMVVAWIGFPALTGAVLADSFFNAITGC